MLKVHYDSVEKQLGCLQQERELLVCDFISNLSIINIGKEGNHTKIAPPPIITWLPGFINIELLSVLWEMEISADIMD